MKNPKKDVSLELDLHGLYVEEALEITDKYLDDAVICDFESVKIIHGYGKGRIREELHKFLLTHHHAKSFRLANIEEGGSAITIVYLK